MPSPNSPPGDSPVGTQFSPALLCRHEFPQAEVVYRCGKEVLQQPSAPWSSSARQEYRAKTYLLKLPDTQADDSAEKPLAADGGTQRRKTFHAK